MHFREILAKLAEVTLDIDKGDVLLGGKYKNSPITVEDIGTDELGQPTVNGRKLLAYRIKKKMSEKKAEKTAISAETLRKLLKIREAKKIHVKSKPAVDGHAVKLAKFVISKGPDNVQDALMAWKKLLDAKAAQPMAKPSVTKILQKRQRRKKYDPMALIRKLTGRGPSGRGGYAAGE